MGSDVGSTPCTSLESIRWIVKCTKNSVTCLSNTGVSTDHVKIPDEI